MKEYLTEEGLANVLKEIFPSEDFIHDRIVLNSNIKSRPDYLCENLKLIVEFDGDQHYRNVAKIKNELKKNQTYSRMGYSIVRIPYFIQISSIVIENLFKKKFSYRQKFPHGFISKSVILTCDFCEVGIKKFENDLEKFSFIKSDIIKSLKDKFLEIRDIELVVPPSLEYLLKN